MPRTFQAFLLRRVVQEPGRVEMRSRNIKPGFFLNEELSDVSYQARLLFIGLWCYSDREGRFEWREKRIKAAIFPYDNLDIGKLLMSLQDATFIYKYLHDGKSYGQVTNFNTHQNPHPHEAKSKLPKPEQYQCHDEQVTLQEMSVKCNADSLIPDTMIPDSYIRHGSHVKLKQGEYDRLKEMLNGSLETYIDKVNDYCAAKGKTYKDYAAAIRNFWRKDGMPKSPQGQTPLRLL